MMPTTLGVNGREVAQDPAAGAQWTFKALQRGERGRIPIDGQLQALDRVRN